jgi:energy-coupling factor transporter transmembrane protein EcfT
MFALDVFSEDSGFWQTIVALLIHLIPTFIVVIALLIGWRWEWVGSVLFGALALFYVVWMWGRFPLVTYLSISGPLALVGVLFLLNWIYRAR